MKIDKKRTISLSLFLPVLMLSFEASSDTVRLKNGRVIEDCTTELAGSTLVVGMAGSRISIPMSRVESVEAGKVHEADETSAGNIVGSALSANGELQFESGDISIFAPPTGGAFWPRLLELQSGEILCAFDANDINPQTDVRVRVSLDGGATWSPRGTVAEGPNLFSNPFLVQIPDGAILCVYREFSGAANHIQTARSTDDGVSWAKIGTVRTSSMGLYEPWLHRLSDGALLCAYADEGTFPQVIEIRFSTDNGVTWGNPVVAAQNAVSRDGVPALIETLSGDLLLFFERQDLANLFAIGALRSSDGGLTWGMRSLVYAPADASRQSTAPTALALESGRLVAVFYTNEDNVSQNDIKWVESDDDGLTWTAPKLFYANGRWGHFIQLRTGRVLGSFSAPWPTARVGLRRGVLPSPSSVGVSQFLKYE